jgi:hypothetical protein
VVKGDVNTFSGILTRADGARIEGQVHSGVAGPFSVTAPGKLKTPQLDINMGLFWKSLWFLFRSFLWAALAALVLLFLPEHTERAAKAAISQPLISLGLGLITMVALPVALAVFALTIIGIPITLIGAFLLIIIWCFGVVVIGSEVGRRLAHALNQEWAPAASAGIGTFLLTLVTNGIGWIVPCIGWIAPAMVGMLGLGAVLLTRFGAQEAVPASWENPPAAPDPQKSESPAEPGLQPPSDEQPLSEVGPISEA